MRPGRSFAGRTIALIGLFSSHFTLVGCGDKGSGDRAAAPLAAPSASASARAPVPTYTKSPRLTEARYVRALGAEDDRLELERLALDAGADELVDALDDGGALARVALAALPFADDGLGALGPLTARAEAARKGASMSARTGEAAPPLAALLETTRTLAERGPEDREVVDPDGVGRALHTLDGLVTDGALPAETRALAADAARAIRAWGP